MKGPTDTFSDLMGNVERTSMLVVVPNEAVPSQADLDQHAEMIGRDLGLVWQKEEAVGYYLVCPMPDGSTRHLVRYRLYASAQPHEVFDAVRKIIEHVAWKFGPGSVWTLGGRVHVIISDGTIFADTIDGKPHVRVRCFVCHENGPRHLVSEPDAQSSSQPQGVAPRGRGDGPGHA